MRYYNIAIPGAPGSFPTRYDGAGIWGTEVGGKHDPGAQQVEFQIEELRPNLPSADSVLTVHGVTFQQIKDTGKLIGLPIIVNGGMRPGLPIATAQSTKAGLLLDARIMRAWGNWIGTEMSIGLSFVPAGASDAQSSSGGGGSSLGGALQSVAGLFGGGGGAGAASVTSVRRTGFRSIDRRAFPRGAVNRLGGDRAIVSPTNIGDIGQFTPPALGAATSTFGGITSSLFGGGIQGLQAPLNLIHDMAPNMPLSSAISQTLSKAFSAGGSNVQIAGGLKLGYQDAGMYQNLQQYASYINKLSQSIMGIKNYPGVQMSAKSNMINVWDTTVPIGQGIIAAIDLIGQPTWIDINMIRIKTMLRGDLTAGMAVTLPPTLLALTPEAIIPGAPAPEQKTSISFTGTFIIYKLRHIGDFRNPDGAGWSTDIDCLLGPGTAMSGPIAGDPTGGGAIQSPA